MGVIGVILAFGGGLLLLYILGMLLVFPLKWLGKLILNSIIGFVVLFILNLVGEALFSFTIPLNVLNALIVGIFGVPGLIVVSTARNEVTWQSH